MLRGGLAGRKSGRDSCVRVVMDGIDTQVLPSATN